MTQTETPAPRAGTYGTLPNERISAGNGIEYVFRRYGSDTRPLVLFQHFRGNLDNWDPALVDQLAGSRRVIAFDNAGVGGTSGRTPGTVREMAVDAWAFLDALDVGDVDLLGFSLGSFVAQEVALIRPWAVKRLILASSAPQGAWGMHGWAPDVIAAVGSREGNPAGYLGVFYSPSEASRSAGMASLQRMTSRTEDRDTPTSWQTRLAQYDAVCDWGIRNDVLVHRVTEIDIPVFVANGDSDPMILPRYSHLLAGLIPHVRLKIYPDAAHGFLFQHHEEFATDVLNFLAEEV
jgi:pimeloyl-ACP methyl ester carboxylesterase